MQNTDIRRIKVKKKQKCSTFETTPDYKNIQIQDGQLKCQCMLVHFGNLVHRKYQSHTSDNRKL